MEKKLLVSLAMEGKFATNVCNIDEGDDILRLWLGSVDRERHWESANAVWSALEKQRKCLEFGPGDVTVGNGARTDGEDVQESSFHASTDVSIGNQVLMSVGNLKVRTDVNLTGSRSC